MKNRPAKPDFDTLAIEALGFLAGDPEKLGRFLGVTGLGPENLRRSARDSGFLHAVLDYLCTDEALLRAFAADAGVDPALLTTWLQQRAAAGRH